MVKTNALATAHLFHAFTPLLLAGKAKTAIAITTAMGTPSFVRTHDFDMGTAYGISKEALNSIVAKFAAQYRKDGLLFMGISPGIVATGSSE